MYSPRAASVAMVAFGVLATACGGGRDDIVSEPTDSATVIELPAPVGAGPLTLEEALVQRRSVREFTPEPLSIETISQLLWAAQGVTSDGGARTSPSAGGLYPLELYLLTDDGVFHYLPHGHRLEQVYADDVQEAVAEAALGQEAVSDAAVVIVIAAVFERTEGKYGERAERYVQLEAGHCAQNVLLQAVALGLGAVPIGAFDDAELAAVLGFPAEVEPLYLLPIGHPDAA